MVKSTAQEPVDDYGRLKTVFKKLSITLVPELSTVQRGLALREASEEIGWYFTTYNTSAVSESQEVANARKRWLMDVRRSAVILAFRLRNGAMRDAIGMQPATLNRLLPIIREIRLAAKSTIAVAKKHGSFGTPSLEKEVNWSSMDELIGSLEIWYLQHIGNTSVKVIENGGKGGKFVDFVQECAKAWGLKKAPSGSAIQKTRQKNVARNKQME